jgi:hypothetical protein
MISCGASGQDANTRLKKSAWLPPCPDVSAAGYGARHRVDRLLATADKLAVRRHEHFVEVPGGAQLPTRSLNAMREARAKLVRPAPDRFGTDDHAALKQQLFNVAQAQLKAKIPAHSATDNSSRNAVAVIKRFRILIAKYNIAMQHLSVYAYSSGTVAFVLIRFPIC